MYYELLFHEKANNPEILKQLGFHSFIRTRVIKPRSVKELKKQCHKKPDEIILLESLNYKLNRYAVEHNFVDGLINVEHNAREDALHYKRSGLDDVLCEFMSKRKISYVINFNALLNTSGETRARILGRMKQNTKLCLKHDTPILITSGARNAYELRSASVLGSFACLLGMNKKQVKQSYRTPIKYVKKVVKPC